MNKGFTLVELSLSMAIISILSIIVLLTISNAVSSYHKGITLNQLNTVGMSLIDDMRSAVQGSPGKFSSASECLIYSDGKITERCIKNGAASFTSVKRYANVRIGNNSNNNVYVPVYGAFCTGAYSYIWNSGYFFNDADYEPIEVYPASFAFLNSEGVKEERTGFKLLKVSDSKKSVCKAAVVNSTEKNYASPSELYNSVNSTFDITCQGTNNINKRMANHVCQRIDTETIDTDLVSSSSGLAIYDLQSMAPAESTFDRYLFYSVSFILGTVQGGVNVDSVNGGDYCVTPEDYDNSAVENFDYCAINKFNFAAQAVGG